MDHSYPFRAPFLSFQSITHYLILQCETTIFQGIDIDPITGPSLKHLIRLLTERQLESLEASRNDFASLFGYQVEGHESEINMISEVDLVLRTGEVLELIQKDTFMGSIEALEVMRKQFSDVLLKNILEDRLMTA
ncbi:hypothetical protein JHK86_043454 [Glycine max]|nr:hypothetical protein JHK86_043454 [Glycine max]